MTRAKDIVKNFRKACTALRLLHRLESQGLQEVVLADSIKCRLQYLSGEPADVADAKSVIFIVRTRIRNAQLVIQQIKHSLWWDMLLLIACFPHHLKATLSIWRIYLILSTST